MISEYASINRYVELTPEFTQITKRDLANLYGVICEINDMFDDNSQNNVRVEEDTTKTSYK